MRILCLDFGNTRLKGALMVNDRAESYYHALDSYLDTWKPIIEESKPERIILSSVVHTDTLLEDYFRTVASFHTLSIHSKLNFTIEVNQPETIGADRLAMVAGAVKQFPNRPILVIGMGTCITYSMIEKNHCFTGGAISPGVDMRFLAMHQQTAKLPLVEFNADINQVGKDTTANLQSGVLYGVLGELEYMISALEQQYQGIEVILTGGNAPYFAERLKRRIFADPDLIYKGLNAIAQIHE